MKNLNMRSSVKLLGRNLVEYAQAASASLAIWLCLTHIFNGASFTVLIRGLGLSRHTVSIQIFTPEADLTILLTSLAAATLLSYRKILSGGWAAKAATLILAASAILHVITPAALLGAAASSALLIYLTASGSAAKGRLIGVAAAVFFTLTLAVTLPAAVRWVLNGFEGSAPLSDQSWSFAYMELQLANALQPITPRLFLIFSAMWVLRLLLWRRGLEDSSKGEDVSTLVTWIIVASSTALAAFVGSYPYLQAVNPSLSLVGVDTKGYYNMMEHLRNLSLQEFLTEVSRADRPLYLTLQQAVATLVGREAAIRVMPAALLTLLTPTVYYLTSADRRGVAALAALYTPITFQAVAGINAGFYANLLALAEANIALALYIKAVDKGGKKHLLGASAATLAVLYTHPATWIILIATIALTAAITLLTRSITRREAKIAAALIAVNLLGEAAKNTLLNNTTTASTAQAMAPHVTLPNILQAIQNLNTTFATFLGGAYSNPLILILATIGLFHIAASRHRLHIILLASTVICTTGALLTESTLPLLLQSRFIYVTPLHILAAYGTQTVASLLSKWIGEHKVSRAATITLHIAIVSSLISYTLREVGFIYIVA